MRTGPATRPIFAGQEHFSVDQHAFMPLPHESAGLVSERKQATDRQPANILGHVPQAASTDRRRLGPRDQVTAAVVPTAVAAGVAAVYMPTATMLAMGLGMAALVFVWRPQLLTAATIVLACAAMPTAVPYSVDLAGISVFIYEPTLVLAALWAGVRLPGTPLADKRVAVLAAVITAWVGYGLLFKGARLGPVVGDVRGLVDLTLALFVASRLAGSRHAGQALIALRLALWWSAALILVASVTGLELSGRSEDASLGITGATSDATRFLTVATFPALAVAAAVLGAIALGAVSLAAAWSYWVPCLPILLLAFSRNSLLGLAVAGVFAALCARSDKRMASFAARGVAALGLVALVALVGPTVMAALPPDSWAATQVTGYSNRVLGGIRSETLARDPSTLFREGENEAMGRAVVDSPVVGHGFGYAYKAPRGPSGQFEAVTAPYYGHQFYLWLTMKTGLVGACLVLWVFFAPLGRALRSVTGPGVALGSAAAALLAVSVVAPLPIGIPTGVQFGAILGALTAYGGIVLRKTMGIQEAASSSREVAEPGGGAATGQVANDHAGPADGYRREPVVRDM